MSSRQSVRIVLYYPQTEEGQVELANRVAAVHADTVTARIRELRCPKAQKLALLDAVIEHTKKNASQNAVHHGPTELELSHARPASGTFGQGPNLPRQAEKRRIAKCIAIRPE